MAIYKPQVKKACHLYRMVGAALAAINQYQEQSRLKPLLHFFITLEKMRNQLVIFFNLWFVYSQFNQ